MNLSELILDSCKNNEQIGTTQEKNPKENENSSSNVLESRTKNTFENTEQNSTKDVPAVQEENTAHIQKAMKTFDLEQQLMKELEEEERDQKQKKASSACGIL